MAEEMLSRRLAELPTQQMSESLKQEIVRRAERADRRRKRTGNAWQGTAVAVGGSTLCLLGWRTFAMLGPDRPSCKASPEHTLQRCSRYACDIPTYTPRSQPSTLP